MGCVIDTVNPQLSSQQLSEFFCYPDCRGDCSIGVFCLVSGDISITFSTMIEWRFEFQRLGLTLLNTQYRNAIKSCVGDGKTVPHYWTTHNGKHVSPSYVTSSNQCIMACPLSNIYGGKHASPFSVTHINGKHAGPASMPSPI